MIKTIKPNLNLRLLLVSSVILTVVLFAGCVGKPQQEELVLSNYPKLFEKDVVVVVGENASQIEMEGAQAIADNLRNLTGNVPVIKKDVEITENEKTGYNLILVGTLDTNSMLRDVYERTNATRVTEEYPGAGKGMLEILRSPWNEDRTMLLIAGSDKFGVREGGELLEDYKELNRSIILSSVKPTALIDVNLSMEGLPKLNQTVELLFTVNPHTSFPNTSIQIQLPEGFVLVNGDLSWRGDLAKNETKRIQAFIKAIKTGNWTIVALARSFREVDSFTETEGKADALFISISEETATVSKKQPVLQRPPMEERVDIQSK
ncbi:S-layer like family, C-terminal region [Candidatus Methanoperedens nitroreducens]|uniref:S-layer like family, C-terminal region n=1 Tax=Candidatus Methanoperedens nitratireducens TaxID=1392998 RepID=A0A062V652_9EURY|nr:hypothetical protein [Candidatus Methanoperedens nitroreducens]KCZ71274.1 S-layer like family, C-terminal region [Candidatus Methanoperedens nitroreducens]MDJ1420300.1 hypothetical protein [Candidatus Methanoperedens sp.]